jgi:hypothetical protein
MNPVREVRTIWKVPVTGPTEWTESETFLAGPDRNINRYVTNITKR